MASNPARQLAELVAALDYHKATHRLEHYKPYGYQLNFHNAKGHQTTVPAVQRALMAANQIGKCITADTLVETPHGLRRADEIQRGDLVFAWDGKRRVEANVGDVIRKPAELCYRVWLSNGQSFGCAGRHIVLCGDGQWRFVERLLQFFESRHRSTVVVVPSGFRASVRCCWKKLLSFLADCRTYRRSCDGQLREVQETDQVVPPSPNDVPKRTSTGWRAGGLGDIGRCIGRLLSVHPSSWDAGRRFVVRCVESLGGISWRSALQSLYYSREVLQSCPAGVADLRSASGEVRGPEPAVSLMSVEGSDSRIVGYSPIGVSEIYDFWIPEHRNYVAAGVVHHNTFSGAMEMAYHLTGLYPEWWAGSRFYHAINAMCGGLTNESVRDLLQKELLGEPTDDRMLGTGAIPKVKLGKPIRKAGVPNAIDSIQVKHVSGAWSKVSFRAYEQGAKKHMGSRIHVGWLDEEPPEDIWAQYLRATFSTKGILYLTFTPEDGITKVVHGFINDIKKGQALIRATWDDAPHMDHDKREQFLSAIPAHQREMRTKGIPLMGSGLVFQVPEEEIAINPLETIPEHWPRVCGVDFGIDHGFAAVWIAWDRDRDIAYVYDAYRASGEKVSEHVSQLKRRGDYIPIIWPHDGLNREKSSGVPLADVYRNEGANMWFEQFSNPPAPGVDEGRGGNSVEFGIEHILHRMQTQRFKVYSTLKEWLEEQRMYHRKDGKIVKQFDDLMDATRYACLSLRHASTPILRVRKSQPPVGARNW